MNEHKRVCKLAYGSRTSSRNQTSCSLCGLHRLPISFHLRRWCPWACTWARRPTCGAAGTFWTASWSLSRSSTSWCPWRAAPKSSAFSAFSGSCGHCDPSGWLRVCGMGTTTSRVSVFLLWQGHQQSSGSETGGGDPHHLPQAHRQYCPHLLCLLHHLRYSRRSGKGDAVQNLW